MTGGCLGQWPSDICRGEAGQGWARLTGREEEGGEYRGGKQPSLQQEEEGGKEKERARACEREKERGKNYGSKLGPGTVKMILEDFDGPNNPRNIKY